MAKRGAFNRRIVSNKTEERKILDSSGRRLRSIKVERMYHATKGYRTRREYPIYNNAAGNLFLSFLPTK